jgi:SAM-dependent methyltransferase
MDATDKVFAGPIPEIYDRLLVPLLFEPYAEDLATRVMALRPKRILELAAGTGALTRALAARGDGASIIATDLNQPMLDLAAKRLPAAGRVTWQQADAQDLPFAPGSFDAAACQFGVMFFPDKARAHDAVRRSLAPGGHYLFNVWDSIARNDFAAVLLGALAEAFPADPPGFIERTPHGYHAIETIERDVMGGGFGRPRIEHVELRSRGASALDVATAFCQGSPVRAEIEARGEPGLAAVTGAVAKALEQRFGSGPIEGDMAAFVISARRE